MFMLTLVFALKSNLCIQLQLNRRLDCK